GGGAANDIGLSAKPPDVLGAEEPLLPEARQLGEPLAVCFDERNCDALQSMQYQKADHCNAEDRKAETPVLPQQGQYDPADQQQAAHDAHDELRKEVGKCGYVAIDALDQLAGGAGVVKSQVESQHVRE